MGCCCPGKADGGGGGGAVEMQAAEATICKIGKQGPKVEVTGANVVGGRLQGDDMMKIAELAEKYGNGEIRLTVEQNFLIPNVPKEKVEELLKDELFSRYSTKPGKIVGNIVACTGNQFCGFAQIETKQNAYKLAEHLESVLDFPKDVRMTVFRDT